MSHYGLENGNGIAIAHTHKNIPIHINAGGVYFVNVNTPTDTYRLNASIVTEDFNKAIDFINQWLGEKDDSDTSVWIVRKYLPFMRKKKIKVKLGDAVMYSDGSDNKKLDQHWVLPENFGVTQAYSNLMTLYNEYKACNSKIAEAEAEKAKVVEKYKNQTDNISYMYVDVTTIDV